MRAVIGHQQIVAGAQRQGWRGNVRQVRTEIGIHQRSQTAKQVFGTLKMCGLVLQLFIQQGGVLRQPVGGEQEQRLSAHIGFHSAVEQQILPHFEAAAGLAVQRRPAVDHHQFFDQLRMSERQLQANHAAQCMADEVTAVDVE
ncbi:hypothetical protein D3C72_1980480 [compost metagenome]